MELKGMVDNLIKRYTEKSHEDATKGEKRLAGVEAGLSGNALKYMNDLKRGVLNEVTFALDGVQDSDVLFQFRVLDAQDSADIEQELLDLCTARKWMPLSPIWNIYRASKILARANRRTV